MTRASDLAKLLGAGATINDGTTITTADNTAQLTLTSTDADASTGPQLVLDRNSSSPADDDRVGEIAFTGRNDANQTTEFAIIQSRIIDASDGTEDGRLILQNIMAGNVVGVMENNSTETVFNQNSVDNDFRVESDNDANALFVEGDTGNVAIGTNDPTVQDAGMRMLHIHNSATDGTGRSSLKLTNGDSTLAASRGAIITLDDAAQLTIGAFESAGKTIFTTGGTTTRMTIDQNGIVTMPYQPVFIATAENTISLSTSFAELTAFSTAQVNIGTHYNTSNGRFTAPVAGTYQFAVASIGNAASTTYRFRFYKNGSSLHNYSYRIDNTAGGGSQYGTNGEYCIVATLSASDYISIFARSDNASDAYANSSYRYSYFRGQLIG